MHKKRVTSVATDIRLDDELTELKMLILMVIGLTTLIAPAIFAFVYFYIKFPTKNAEWAQLAALRWMVLKNTQLFLIFCLTLYGALAYEFVFPHEPFLISFILIGVGSLTPKILMPLISLLYPIVMGIVKMLPMFLSLILYLCVQGWGERRIRNTTFSIINYVRLTFFGYMYAFLPYWVILMLALSKFTPWEIHNHKVVWFNMWIAVYIIIIAIGAYLYNFSLSIKLLGMATPLTDEYFNKRTEELGSALEVEIKRLFRFKTFDLPFAHAYASSNGHIYLSDSIINGFSRMDADAILAHEVSHLKHIKPLALKKTMYFISIIVGVFFIYPLGELLPSQNNMSLLFKLSVMLVICLLFIFANKAGQKYEMEADRLATELVGKEAYIKALEKIHEMNLIPRQFTENGKETLSHPSLEARIKAVEHEG